MSTSTDASTVLSEATRLAEGTTIEEHTANGAAVPVGERPAVNGAPPVEEDTLTHGGAAPDESGTAADPSSGERTPSAGDTAAGEGTAVDRPASPDGSVPVDASEPASWLRIEKGHAEPEEIAAISVVLCARLMRPPGPRRGRPARGTTAGQAAPRAPLRMLVGLLDLRLIPGAGPDGWSAEGGQEHRHRGDRECPDHAAEDHLPLPGRQPPTAQ